MPIRATSVPIRFARQDFWSLNCQDTMRRDNTLNKQIKYVKIKKMTSVHYHFHGKYARSFKLVQKPGERQEMGQKTLGEKMARR